MIFTLLQIVKSGILVSDRGEGPGGPKEIPGARCGLSERQGGDLYVAE